MGANRRGLTTCRVGLAEGVRRPKRARSSKRRKASLRCIPWISRAAWRLAAREQTASPLWMVRLLPPIWTYHCRVGLCLIARWAPDVQCSEERAETLAPARHTWFRSVSGKAASRSGLTSVRQKRPTYRLPQGCAENLAPAPCTCFDTCPRRAANPQVPQAAAPATPNHTRIDKDGRLALAGDSRGRVLGFDLPP